MVAATAPVGALFQLPSTFFDGAVADGDDATGPAPPPPESGAPARRAEPAEDGGALTCRVCGVGAWGEVGGGILRGRVASGASADAPCLPPGTTADTPPFPTVASQRAHFRADWHRMNARRAASGRAPVDEAAAERALGGGGGGSVSSLSGSDSSGSESEDDGGDRGRVAGHSRAGPGALAAFARPGGARFAVWRALLAPAGRREKAPPGNALAALLATRGLPWAVVLAKGGHFAAAVFDVASPRPAPTTPFPALHHATAHRYVVRAKAGGRQSAKDGTGKAIKSAGSSLRRYNEAALDADIQGALTAWAPALSQCSLIFAHAPGQANAASVFGRGGLARADARVRPVPFPVRRPTLSEAQRVVRTLLTVYEAPEEVVVAAPARVREPKAAPPPPAPVPPPPKPTETPLVVAARSGDDAEVARLLAAGADPGAPSLGGRRPYDCAASKPVRDAFRRAAAAAPDAHDWGAAGVPSALTPEMEAAQAARTAEKKTRQRAAEKERKAAEKADKERKAAAAKIADELALAAEVEAAAREAARLSVG
jgi:hypothetical protein